MFLHFLRERLLQEANTKHQDFQNVSQSLSSFLDNLPNNKIDPKDDLSQVNAKQNSQKVRFVDYIRQYILYKINDLINNSTHKKL